MIPNNSLSSAPVVADYLENVNDPKITLVDYEMGGVAINDASQGFWVRKWELYYEGSDVKIRADGVAPETLFTLPNITELSLAFDQNMRPAVAYVQADVAYLRWYDSTIPGYDILSFPEAISPRVCLDDKRDVLITVSDIILAYVKNNNLYFRAQRDRFLDEYLLKEDVGGTLVTVGMAKNYRLKFKLQTVD